jgi:hypothetical protein
MSNTTAFVLVACPTYDRKAYALNAYLEGYESLTYPNKDLYLVDTTPTNFDYMVALRKRNIHADWYPVQMTMDPSRRLTPIWREIIDYAHSQSADYVLTLEQDIIPPHDVIEIMLDFVQPGRAVASEYPLRGVEGIIANGVGCALVPVNTLHRITWDKSMFEQMVHENLDACVLKLGDIQHLGEAGYES